MIQLLYIPLFILTSIILIILIIIGIIYKKNKLIYGSISFFIIFIISIFVSKYYFFEREIISKQNVEIFPLKNIKLKNNLNSIDDMLEKYEIHCTNGYLKNGMKQPDGMKEWYTKREFYKETTVELILFYTQKEADELYDFEIKHSDIYPIDSIFQDDNGKYCISFVTGLRADPEGGGLPTGEFISFVKFQKKNLIITIEERSNDKNNHDKDEVIKVIAEKLEKLNSKLKIQ